MDTKILVDAIVRQTTVLIAQLSTAAGIRAPLAHVADHSPPWTTATRSG